MSNRITLTKSLIAKAIDSGTEPQSLTLDDYEALMEHTVAEIAKRDGVDAHTAYRHAAADPLYAAAYALHGALQRRTAAAQS